MQHLWLTERIVDIVAAELGLDPVEIRKRNYVKAEQMPYETPNGCVYDSGDYAAALDIALDLIDHGSIEERRKDAASRGKLLGFGIGSTLDSGTNNFGQSTLLNPDLQFSGNNEAASVKLDIFGEVVVTLGTVPQGQGHETTAAQVVADILGCSPDQVNVRRGHDTWFNSHAGFSGTYASQFAFTGLGAVKGAAELLREEMVQLAAAVLQAPPRRSSSRTASRAIKDGPEEAALPFMALGAIVNANNAFLPPDFNPTLNHRYVCRPYFGMVDTEKKTGQLTLTYATQIHAAVVEVDPETGEVEIVDYAAVDDCGVRINPQIVEGQVHGATAHAIGAALSRGVRLRRGGDAPDLQLLRLPRAPRAGHAAAEDGRDGVSVPGGAARREGHGRGRRRRHPLHLRRDPGRARRGREADRVRRAATRRIGCGRCSSDPESTRAERDRGVEVIVSGTKELAAPRERVWEVINEPAEMAKLMPGVESFEITDDDALDGEGQGAARARRTEDDDELREARGARARVRVDAREGPGRRRAHGHDDVVHALRGGRRHLDGVGGGREDRGPGRRDGPARPAADREPAGAAGARRARAARLHHVRRLRRRHRWPSPSASA